MKQLAIQGSGRRGENGQMLPLIAFSLVALVGLVGLAIDLGFAYVTRSRLSKAADAAALAGMQNIGQGISTAGSIATATFYANYAGGAKQTSLDKGPVTPTLTFSPNSAAATQLTVSATTSIRTFFSPVVGLLGNRWTQLTIGNSSIVSRGHIDIELVLDKSGSMNGNGGRGQMYPSVTNFLSFFSDTLDKVGMVTFATFATVNAPITNNFTASISSAVKTIYNTGPYPGGYTAGAAGMTNALAIEKAIPWPTQSNLVKAVVFFTDGQMNTIQNALACPGAVNFVFTSGDPPQTTIDFYDAVTQGYQGTKTTSGGGYCSSVRSFPSLHAAGGTFSFVDGLAYQHVRDEAKDRCETYAAQMRDAGIVVCTVGLGVGPNGPDAQFLRIVANDPDEPNLTPTPYDGIFVAATNSTDMVAAFQRVAENLSLRLIH